MFEPVTFRNVLCILVYPVKTLNLEAKPQPFPVLEVYCFLKASENRWFGGKTPLKSMVFFRLSDSSGGTSTKLRSRMPERPGIYMGCCAVRCILGAWLFGSGPQTTGFDPHLACGIPRVPLAWRNGWPGWCDVQIEQFKVHAPVRSHQASNSSFRCRWGPQKDATMRREAGSW